jgi:hypothetical protein
VAGGVANRPNGAFELPFGSPVRRTDPGYYYGVFPPAPTNFPPAPTPYVPKRSHEIHGGRHDCWCGAKKGIKMIPSTALWCGDPDTGHAFSSKDPNKRRLIEEREIEDKYGETRTEQEEFWACGNCRKQQAEAAKRAREALRGPKDDVLSEEVTEAEIVDP